jgi:hypothetical protein
MADSMPRLLHVGMEIDFHHPDGDSLELTPEVEDLYGQEKDLAPLFMRLVDGVRISARDLLDDYLAAAGKTVADIPFGAGGTGIVVLDIQPGRYAMETKAGRVDVRRVRLVFRRLADTPLH